MRLVYPLLACFALLAGAAHADVETASEADKHVARQLVRTGDEKFEAGDYQGALNDYRGADAIMQVPTTMIEVARALAALNRLREAKATYKRVLAYPSAEDEPAAFGSARAKAESGLVELDPRIPRLQVVVEWEGEPSPELMLSVDGGQIAAGTEAELDPGTHEIRVEATGHTAEQVTVELAEAEKKQITVLMKPVVTVPSPIPVPNVVGPSMDPPSTIPAWTWVGVGFAAVGGIVGTVTGVMSLSKASDLEAQAIGDNLYPESSRPLQEESVLLAHVSTVSVAVAGAGAAVAIAGIIVYLTNEEPVTSGGMVGWRF